MSTIRYDYHRHAPWPACDVGNPDCRGGWLTAHPDYPRPCLDCKPHLIDGTRSVDILRPEWSSA